jgi:hypothetical protein
LVLQLRDCDSRGERRGGDAAADRARDENRTGRLFRMGKEIERKPNEISEGTEGFYGLRNAFDPDRIAAFEPVVRPEGSRSFEGYAGRGQTDRVETEFAAGSPERDLAGGTEGRFPETGRCLGGRAGCLLRGGRFGRELGDESQEGRSFKTFERKGLGFAFETPAHERPQGDGKIAGEGKERDDPVRVEVLPFEFDAGNMFAIHVRRESSADEARFRP